MKFTKMQGCGNDYVYINCFEEDPADPVQEEESDEDEDSEDDEELLG